MRYSGPVTSRERAEEFYRYVERERFITQPRALPAAPPPETNSPLDRLERELEEIGKKRPWDKATGAPTYARTESSAGEGEAG